MPTPAFAGETHPRRPPYNRRLLDHMDFTIPLRKREATQAQALQAKLRLRDITLYRCEADGAGPLSEPLEPIRLEAALDSEKLDSGGASGLDFAIRLHVVCDEPAFNIDVTVLVRYLFAVGAKTATANEIEAFRKSHAVLTVWPYLREFVQTLTARMGFPTEPLPLLRLTSPGR